MLSAAIGGKEAFKTDGILGQTIVSTTVVPSTTSPMTEEAQVPDHPSWVDDERAPNNRSPIYPRPSVLLAIPNKRPLWHDVCFGRDPPEISTTDTSTCKGYCRSHFVEVSDYVDFEFDSGAGSPIDLVFEVDAALCFGVDG